MGIIGEKHSLDTREDQLFIQATNLSVWGFVWFCRRKGAAGRLVL